MQNETLGKCSAIINRVLIALLLVCCFVPVSAHAVKITSGELEDFCTPTLTSAGKPMCTYIVEVFLEGYGEGIIAGVMGMLRNESKTSGLSQNSASRTTDVSSITACVLNVTPDNLIGAFLGHMRAHPEERASGYGKALDITIQTVFCKR